MIDYLQLIQPDDPRDPRQEQVAKMARRLKGLARELKIPVLCLAQLNRQAEQGKEGHRPRLSHLRESGAIEQDADVVMFIHREEYYHTREEAQEKGIAGQADVIVAKQRNGPTGECQARLVRQAHPLREPRPKAVRGVCRVRGGRVLTSIMQFRWNRWNIEHIASHGVSSEEAENLILNAKRPYPQAREDDKWRVVGRGRGGRWLQVIFVIDPEDTIFVIHARPLTEREKHLEKKRGK